PGLSHAVAPSNTRSGRWSALHSRLHQQPVLNREIQSLRKIATDGKSPDAQVGEMHAAFGNQVVRDSLCCVYRNGESDACGSACWSENRRIDSDHFAARIDQRSAGVAAVDGGVSLNRFIDKGRLASLHRSTKRADHTSGQRALKSEWIANSQNLLAHLQ